MKTVIKILGFAFLLAGLVTLMNLFSTGGVTQDLYIISLRLINSAVWIITGYGLLRLKQWSIFGFLGMIGLRIFTSISNVVYANKDAAQENLWVPAIYILILLILFAKREKYLKD